jgi:hypothetical protein
MDTMKGISVYANIKIRQCFSYEELYTTEEKWNAMDEEEVQNYLIHQLNPPWDWTFHEVDDVDKENERLEETAYKDWL